VIEECAPGYWFDMNGACACVSTDECDALECEPWEIKGDCQCFQMKTCDYIKRCKPGYEWDMSDEVCDCVLVECDDLRCMPWESIVNC
jgi:hypothetical protein